MANHNLNKRVERLEQAEGLDTVERVSAIYLVGLSPHGDEPDPDVEPVLYWTNPNFKGEDSQ